MNRTCVYMRGNANAPMILPRPVHNRARPIGHLAPWHREALACDDVSTAIADASPAWLTVMCDAARRIARPGAV